jgi:hypothetical protein
VFVKVVLSFIRSITDFVHFEVSSLMKLFAPNIGTSGRIARGLCGLAALGAAWLSRESLAAGTALALGGFFMLFEAFRGWCLARACGLKTPM